VPLNRISAIVVLGESQFFSIYSSSGGLATGAVLRSVVFDIKCRAELLFINNRGIQLQAKESE
jgi:hypothetical protein